MRRRVAHDAAVHDVYVRPALRVEGPLELRRVRGGEAKVERRLAPDAERRRVAEAEDADRAGRLRRDDLGAAEPERVDRDAADRVLVAGNVPVSEDRVALHPWPAGEKMGLAQVIDYAKPTLDEEDGQHRAHRGRGEEPASPPAGHRQAGSCWVMQWIVPSPSTRSTAWMPTTRRPGKSSASVASARRSAGSLKVGTSTAALPT